MLDENATIPVVSLPTIMAFYVQSFVCVPSLSSPLLLRISPHTFAFIPIPPMSLSSRNRSNSKAFRHIMPYCAPVCEGMHYHKTRVPWQMNNTFIGISYLQNRIKLLQFAPVCQAAEVSVILQKIGPNGKVAQSVANLCRQS